ncbi:hypothetical protein ACFX11_030869 [Malus domestica]
MNYQYTLISNSSENRSTSGGSDNSNPTSSLNIKRFCYVLSREVRNHAFDLKYSSRCSPAKNCTHLFASDLARVVSLKPIECLKDAKRLRFLVEFVDSNNVWYRRPFDPNTTLIGEGSWDAETNQLSCVACRFLDAAGSWNNTRVAKGSHQQLQGSHQQLQGVSKVVSMASKGSCDPIDPIVDPPLDEKEAEVEGTKERKGAEKGYAVEM